MVFYVTVSLVNSRKYEKFLQFNASWLTSLKEYDIILDFVLASVTLAMTLY